MIKQIRKRDRIANKIHMSEKPLVRDHSIQVVDRILLKRSEIHEPLMKLAQTVNNSPREITPPREPLPKHLLDQPTKEDIEAREFVKSLKNKEKERKSRILQLNLSLNEKRLLQQQQKSLLQETEKQDQKSFKQTQLDLRLKHLQQKQEERDKLKLEWQEQVRRLGTPLYKKKEREFHENVVLPQINSDREALATIQERMKQPMDQQAILQHQRRYREMLKIQEIKALESASTPKVESAKFYESKFYDQVRDQDTKRRQDQSDRVEFMKKLRQKQETYYKFVKEVHPAKPSQQKTMELQSQIAHLKHKVKMPKESYDNYLVEFQRTDNGKKHNRNNSQIIKTAEIESEKQPEKKRIDYLQELRIQRHAQSLNNSPKHSNSVALTSSIKKTLRQKDLTYKEKLDLVKMQSEAIEKKAEACQIKGTQQRDLLKQGEANKLYLESIRAKMTLIEQL